MRAFLLFLVACQAPIEGASSIASSSAELDRTVIGAPAGDSLTVAMGGLRLWIERDVRIRPRAGGFDVVLRGRANQEVSSVFTFVPDDAFAMAQTTGPRSFEIIVASGGELNTLLSGLPLLLRVDPITPQPTSFVAQLRLSPRLVGVQSAGIQLSRVIAPVFRRDPSPLRYRVTARLPAGASDLTAPPDVDLGHVGDEWAMDWTYDELVAAQGVQLSANAVDGSPISASARFGLHVATLAMTDDDPYVVFPPPTCTVNVQGCVDGTLGPDLGACGSYRAVQSCARNDACAYVPPEAPAVTSTDASALAGPAAAWDAGCTSGYSWCNLAEPTAFELPECLDRAPDAADVAALVLQTSQDLAWTFDLSTGEVLDRAALEQHLFFSAGMAAGPTLLAAVDAWAGATDAVAWSAISELPCPNCTDFEDLLIVWYPSVGKVAVLRGGHGWDS